MKIDIIRVLKNIGCKIIKFGLLFCLLYYIFNMGVSFYTNLISDYNNYVYVRGFENYGVEIQAQNYIENKYKYVVDNVMYTYTLEDNTVQPIDNCIEIYYDILEPKNVILKDELKEIDSFYSDIMKGLVEVYLSIVLSVFLYSLMWYLLDCFKYCKILWKTHV